MAAGKNQQPIPPDATVYETQGQPIGRWLGGSGEDVEPDATIYETRGAPIGKWLGGSKEEIEPSALQAYFADLDRPVIQSARAPVATDQPTAADAERMWSQGRAGKLPWGATDKPVMQMARGPMTDENSTWERGRYTASPTLDTFRRSGERFAESKPTQSLTAWLQENAPLTRGVARETQGTADTLENAKDPWVWMERKGYVAPQGVDLQQRAQTSREDVDRARLGLASDWTRSAEGSAEMQHRLAGETTPTHVWDRPTETATPGQRYSPGAQSAAQLYAQQYGAMPRYGLPPVQQDSQQYAGQPQYSTPGVQLRPPASRSPAEWAAIKAGQGPYSARAHGEFAARTANGETPEDILSQERARRQPPVPWHRRDRLTWTPEDYLAYDRARAAAEAQWRR